MKHLRRIGLVLIFVLTARSVDRCINTLRGKIERNPDNPFFIKTIRDVGYRFES
ncbi:MAG: winged helix-turn-helix domain-containing protein [Acidobacteria bacterium]|nr:winged helix-turn-helix domain-containing protein [Acidobacteriota bacterium]